MHAISSLSMKQGTILKNAMRRLFKTFIHSEHVILTEIIGECVT